MRIRDRAQHGNSWSRLTPAFALADNERRVAMQTGGQPEQSLAWIISSVGGFDSLYSVKEGHLTWTI